MILPANSSAIIDVLLDMCSASEFRSRIDLTLSLLSPQHEAHLSHLKLTRLGYSKLKSTSPDDNMIKSLKITGANLKESPPPIEAKNFILSNDSS